MVTQVQLEKQKRVSDTAHEKASENEQKVLALQKEIDSLNRVHKQTDHESGAKDVRCTVIHTRGLLMYAVLAG